MRERKKKEKVREKRKNKWTEINENKTKKQIIKEGMGKEIKFVESITSK
jgi:hypothetical protein